MHLEKFFIILGGGLFFGLSMSAIAFLLNKFHTIHPVHAYKGQGLSANKIAILRTEDEIKHKIAFGYNKRVIITRIDGRLIFQFLSIFMPIQSRFVYLLPGKHDVTLLFQNHGLSAKAKLWFFAEQGKSYTAKAIMKGFNVHFWIEDDATHKETGGVQGSSDEPKETK